MWVTIRVDDIISNEFSLGRTGSAVFSLLEYNDDTECSEEICTAAKVVSADQVRKHRFNLWSRVGDTYLVGPDWI
jgi:hypothetical protein